MNNLSFKCSFNQAVDLHRHGQTREALSAIEQLMGNAVSDGQRLACINEKIHLLDHLGRRDEVMKLGSELAALLPKSPKSKALFQFLERGRKAQASGDAILASHESRMTRS